MNESLGSGYTLEAVGERCILIRVGTMLDEVVVRRVHALTAQISAAALPGVDEVVPAFTTVAVQYRPQVFALSQGLPSVQLMNLLHPLVHTTAAYSAPASGRHIDIPACYDAEFAPDLPEVARFAGLSVDEVIALHSGCEMTVYAFFFAPGNAFSGPMDPRLHIGRRTTPRTRVEAGSVAIANGLTSIYQNTSPGGWQIIARTPWSLFDVAQQPPVRLRLGDRIRFRPVSRSEFDTLLEARP